MHLGARRFVLQHLMAPQVISDTLGVSPGTASCGPHINSFGRGHTGFAQSPLRSWYSRTTPSSAQETNHSAGNWTSPKVSSKKKARGQRGNTGVKAHALQVPTEVCPPSQTKTKKWNRKSLKIPLHQILGMSLKFSLNLSFSKSLKWGCCPFERTCA